MNLPDKYISEMKQLLGSEFQDYLNSFSVPSVSSLRINTLKISRDAFMSMFPDLKPVEWCDEGFYYPDSFRATLSPYHYAGLYYIQEASAMAPVEALDIHPDNKVLDLCSAPGGKSTQIACKLSGRGLLVSNDISSSRQQITAKNIARFGIRNCYVTAEDSDTLKHKYPCYFDRILLDAPCSGEGMFRKDPSLIVHWQNNDSSYYAPIQKQLIIDALAMLKDGGKLVYSTCTFDVRENEEVIRYALDNCPQARLLDTELRISGVVSGLNGLDKCCRLYPHKVNGEGHFVALLTKGTPEKTAITITDSHPPELPEFMNNTSCKLQGYKTRTIRNSLYLEPPSDFDNSSVRTLQSGLYLGELRNGTLKPSQHLAFALKPAEFNQVLRLSADDVRTEKYLKGETIEIDSDASGWMLVCLDDYPLGFGVASGKRLKNRIDPGFRKL